METQEHPPENEPRPAVTIVVGEWVECPHKRLTWLRVDGNPVCGECLGNRQCLMFEESEP